ncbi:MAG: cofactor-independent phosphoglycerate mutase [Candidatus Omnitrophica bacterium]|nr:cofactor-independent phosphoglycerate mutase [Candidatus Omnitrophota bacterium]
MKYIVLIPDGMADYPVVELQGRTPLEVAQKPNMDYCAKFGILGKVKTIPPNMTPASDVANMSILGYDPQIYYSGRGPLEAANMGIELENDDVAFRCNLITAVDDRLVDYSAGHISTKEAQNIIKWLDQKLGNKEIRFYAGISYRHLVLFRNGSKKKLDALKCVAPHDIVNQSINKNLPRGENADLVINLMQESRKILAEHEINQVRIDLGENPANMIWLWGQGKKPNLPLFKEKFGITGSVISAVDLIKGMGKLVGLEVISVPGATGYYDTNYAGKAEAALNSLSNHDFVFVHVEAPDEAGHNGDIREKITAIERFDQFIVGACLERYKQKGNLRMLILPDHPTPLSLRTHTADPVPFCIFGEGITGKGFKTFSEKEAEKSTLFLERGYQLMEHFIKNDFDNNFLSRRQTDES